MSDLNKLKELASRTHVEEWEYKVINGDKRVIVKGSLERGQGYFSCRSVVDEIDSTPNAKFIASANPATIIGLIDRLEAAEAELARRDAAAGEPKSWMTQEQMQSEANIYRHDNDEGTYAWFDATTALWTEGYLSPSVFHHTFKPDEAGGWLDDEIALIEEEGRSAQSYREIRNGETENPVVVVFDNGRVIVWDGFHRIAAAVARKEPVYAIFAYTAVPPSALPPEKAVDEKQFASALNALNDCLLDCGDSEQGLRLAFMAADIKWKEAE